MPQHRAPALLLASVLTLAAAARTAASQATAHAAPDTTVGPRADSRAGFRAPLGVQLWSFRAQADSNLLAALTMTRRMGFTHVETAGLYGLTAAQLAGALRAADLKATSMHVGYDDLKKDPQRVVANAKALGARYVGIAWYPHDTSGFTEADARRAVDDFTAFGRTLKAAGLTFFYHNHGYEPVPAAGGGTLLDYLIQHTDPQLVSFEMDALWTWLPGQDPVALIRRYPGRFKLMHVKDMRPGVARGSLKGGLPAGQQAVIGEGQIDWPRLLQAAERDGFAGYYVEDETTDPVRNAPRSVAYLKAVRLP